MKSEDGRLQFFVPFAVLVITIVFILRYPGNNRRRLHCFNIVLLWAKELIINAKPVTALLLWAKGGGISGSRLCAQLCPGIQVSRCRC